MSFITRLVPLCLLPLLAISLYAKDTKPKIEKQPGWITVTNADYSTTVLDADAEDGYADLNYEQQV